MNNADAQQLIQGSQDPQSENNDEIIEQYERRGSLKVVGSYNSNMQG